MERTSAERVAHTVKLSTPSRTCRLLLAQSWCTLRVARGIRCAHDSICARPRHRDPEIAKPAEAAGLRISGEAGETRVFGDIELPRNREISQAPLACTGKVRPKSAASERVALQPRRPLVPEFTLDPLTAAPGRRPSGARLYHRGSVFSEPARCRMDRAHAWRLLAHAEALERDTRAPGKHGGCLKHSGLKVLRALLRHFYSYRHGTCFPSYEAIARAAGCCVETVRKAIRRLESAGILSTIRRKIVTSFVSRGHRVRFDVAVQTSNSYTFNVPGGRPNAQPVPVRSKRPRKPPLQRLMLFFGVKPAKG